MPKIDSYRLELNDNGWILLDSITSKEDALQLFCAILGCPLESVNRNIIRIERFSQLPSSTSSDIPWHQEDYHQTNRPQYIGLWCQRAGYESESTLLSSMDLIIQQMDINLFNALDNLYIRFKRKRSQYFTQWYRLYEKAYGLRFAYPDCRFREVELQSNKINIPSSHILDKLIYSVDCAPNTKIVWEPGLMIIIDNFRFLHARTKLRDDSKRILHRLVNE